MDKLLLTEFLDPFKEIGSFNKAVQIIAYNLSSLKRNLADVAQIIQTIVAPYLSIIRLIRFIERAELMPDFYGLT